MTVSFIGSGRACASFSSYLEKKGIRVAHRLKRSDFDEAVGAVLSDSSVVFITTPDDAINSVAKRIAATGLDYSNIIFAHMSGACPSGELSPLEASAGIFSLHPMVSMAGQYIDFSKVFFALEGRGDINAFSDFLKSADINAAYIKSEDKALYHAAACICANYAVTLADISKRLYESIGLGEDDIQKIIVPLLRTVVQNIEERGTEGAITGPVSRGDVNMVKKHIDALKGYGSVCKIYMLLAEQTADLAARCGRVSAETCGKIIKVCENA